MTVVTIYKTRTSNYKGFFCSGHAGYRVSGSDIVCAGISVLVQNTVNAMETLIPDGSGLLEVKEQTAEIRYKFQQDPNEREVLLMDAMLLGLKGIEQQYGKKYLKLTFKEV